MAAKFKVGESVRVAGGPLMTVKEHDAAGRAVCSWYESHIGWRRESFDEKVLMKSYDRRAAWKKTAGRAR